MRIEQYAVEEDHPEKDDGTKMELLQETCTKCGQSCGITNQPQPKTSRSGGFSWDTWRFDTDMMGTDFRGYD